ncbi:hypothetical protein KDA_20130 [Dictyobacter alpinus]|uniref:PrsW family intramembrane metalloprotease n=1 Tax=Dictyobacter alpinus TaxID=2014873 RepID=A0A402B599_9CHLR|nr:PrsW family glutamic-type intramembrane protease [Dictyobacter alpinus]GCE26529.1 hypothetical protein KDA_20130 [Dictyobacter alpinus]
MGFDYKGSAPDPNKQNKPYPNANPSEHRDAGYPARLPEGRSAEELERYEEPQYREHVSGPLRYSDVPLRAAQPPAQTPPSHHPVQPQPLYQQPGYGQPPYQQPGQNGHAPYNQQPAANGWGQPYPAQPHYPYAPQGGYQPQYNGYAPYGYPPYGYAPYGYPPYSWQPAKPKRDTYQFVIAIIATVCSGLVLITGAICSLLLLVTVISLPYSAANTSKPEQLFSGVTMLTALTLAGLGGGSFSLYHSIRALMRKKSWEFKVTSIRLGHFKLPWFALWLALYVVMLIIGLLIRGNEQIAANTWLTVLLIGLAGLLPALTIFALGAWRVHNKNDEHWTTTWRRVAVAMTSGATSAILFALILELILGLVLQAGLRINSLNLDDPNMPIPNNMRAIIYLFLVVAVVAPVVEEGVKPLAVVTFIGRISSAKEAFILGMACGIGFDLVETAGYIGMGYSNWVDIAIQRSSAGLLHSFGAGMTALGWYYLTHSNSLKNKRILIGLGCGLYAVLQHAIWNGSFVFQILPAPIGPYFDKGTIMIGSYPLPSIMIIYGVWTLLMVLFFLFVTGKLGRNRINQGPVNTPKPSDDVRANIPAANIYPTNQQPQPVR